MGFLAGFSKGLGDTAQNFVQNQLNLKMRQAESVGKIWETMANDQNYAPEVRQQFMQNAVTANNRNPFDKNSETAYQQLLKTDPHETAVRAHEAQQMTGVDPNRQFYDPSGYSGPQQRINFDVSKMQQELGTRMHAFQAWAQQNVDNQPSSGDEMSDAYRRSVTYHDGMVMFMGGNRGLIRPSPPQRIPQGVTYTDDKGGKHVGVPGWQLADPYGNTGIWVQDPDDPTGIHKRRVNADSTLQPRIMSAQMPSGAMELTNLVPGMPGGAPTGVAAPPIPLGSQSQTTTQQNPLTLQTSKTESQQRILTPPPTVAPPPIGGLGTFPSTAPPVASPQPRRRTIPGPPVPTPGPTPIVPPTGSNAFIPSASDVKASTNQRSEQLEQDSWDALQTIDKIAQVHAKHPILGAAFGRAVSAANSLGVAGFVSSLAQMAGKDTTQARNQMLLDNLQKLVNDKKMYAQFGVPPGKENEWATAAGEMITLMRSLGAMDVRMLSGSANGIFRMYQLMQPSLININQDSPIAIGHAIGIGDMASSRLNSIYLKRYGSDIASHIPPTRIDLANRLGQWDAIIGGSGAGLGAGQATPSAPNLRPTITAKGGQHAGQLLYLDTKDGRYYPTQHK